jgi:hypothetical protein
MLTRALKSVSLFLGTAQALGEHSICSIGGVVEVLATMWDSQGRCEDA